MSLRVDLLLLQHQIAYGHFDVNGQGRPRTGGLVLCTIHRPGTVGLDVAQATVEINRGRSALRNDDLYLAQA